MVTVDQLNQYRWMRQERNQLQERIASLQCKSSGVAHMTGAPAHGGDGRTVEDAVISVDQLIETYRVLTAKLNREMAKIEQAIEGLDADARVIFRYKYIECLSMQEVAIRVGYSERQCWNIHREALKKIS